MFHIYVENRSVSRTVHSPYQNNVLHVTVLLILRQSQKSPKQSLFSLSPKESREVGGQK